MNANSGYVGWSMSVRAMDAYEMGEMPKSRWTKATMLGAISRCLDDNELTLAKDAVDYLCKLTKAELFDRFFWRSSWHHTSKFFNVTDFYSVNEDEVVDYARRPTKRVYYIRYRLGGSKRMSIDTYRTRSIAVKHLKNKGFREIGEDAFNKYEFIAIVSWNKVEI